MVWVGSSRVVLMQESKGENFFFEKKNVMLKLIWQGREGFFREGKLMWESEG